MFLMSAAIRTKKVGLFIVFVLLLTGTASQAASSVPNFVLPSVVDGRNVNSNEFNGKVLLVTLFATWCAPCRQEIPTLIRLQNELAGKGFSVIGLSVDRGGTDAVRKMVKKNKINYPVLLSEPEVISGFGRISFIPTSFLINRNREIVKKYRGYIPYQELKRDITPLLAAQSPAPARKRKGTERRKNVIIIRKIIIL